MAATPPLAKMLIGFSSPTPSSDFNQVTALGNTVRDLLQGSRIVHPRWLGRLCHDLDEQQDSEEFTSALLDACQQTQLRALGANQIGHRWHLGGKELTLHSQQVTPIQQTVGGWLRSTIFWGSDEELEVPDAKQKKNEYLTSVSYEPFTVLNLPLVGHTLEDCFDGFCSPEELGGKTYETPGGVFVDAKKVLSIHVPPKVMIVQLKCFDNNGNKIHKSIRFKENLDVTKWISDQRMEACNYTLRAFTTHIGKTPSAGHYTAFVRGQKGTWYFCDDGEVSPSSVSHVLKQPAYLLWFTLNTE